MLVHNAFIDKSSAYKRLFIKSGIPQTRGTSCEHVSAVATNKATLHMRCLAMGFTTVGFVQFTAIYLNMRCCQQRTKSDEAFRHLSNMSQCNQSTITNEAFRHLSNLQHLYMAGFPQPTITDEAIRHLLNLQSSNTSNCSNQRLRMKDSAICQICSLCVWQDATNRPLLLKHLTICRI